MNLTEERKTKVSNDILNNLFKYYNETQVKMFLLIVNKAISSYYAKRKEYDLETDIYTEEDKEIIVSLDFIREYKGNKHMTYYEIESVVHSLMNIVLIFKDNQDNTRMITAISDAILEDDKNRFIIRLNDKSIEYLVLVSENYSCVDIEIVKTLRGKYEIALYVIYCMYHTIKHKSKIYSLQDYTVYVNSKKTTTSNVMLKTNKAIEKLNQKGISINVEPIKRKNKISQLKFTF